MEELVQRAMCGDKAAYTEVIESIQDILYRIAKIRLGDNIDDINDAIQETMIVSYTKLHKLKNVTFFKTWIIRILINQCNKIYEKREKHKNIYDKVLYKFKFNKESDIEIVEDKLFLEKVIKCLSDEERMILELYYNEYSIKEISTILRVNENTIKSRISRGKKKLQIYIGGKYE